MKEVFKKKSVVNGDKSLKKKSKNGGGARNKAKKSDIKKSNNKVKNIKKNVQVGIESIGFYTSSSFFALKDLAHEKSKDKNKTEEENKKTEEYLVNKYEKGLGQTSMSIIKPSEDIITMAYDAVSRCLGSYKLSEDIDLLLFATESAVDNSKSAACELYGLFEHEEGHQCRCIEVKHACYGGTGALMMAKEHIFNNPDKKALVVMSDIAFYGIETKGEPTQGCGAVAILLSSDPKIAVLNNDNVFFSSNKNDFYRPVYQTKPLYDGKFSIKCYLEMFKKTYDEYIKKNESFDFLISHMPFARMLDKCCEMVKIDKENNKNEYIKYLQKYIGNTYTASLYIGLYSLLVFEPEYKNLYGKKIALFSYGSGAECEMFSVTILKNYDKYLKQKLPNNIKDTTNNVACRINNSDNAVNLGENFFRLSIEVLLGKLVNYINYKEYCRLLEKFENREKSLDWDGIELKIKNGVRCYREEICNRDDTAVELKNHKKS